MLCSRQKCYMIKSKAMLWQNFCPLTKKCKKIFDSWVKQWSQADKLLIDERFITFSRTTDFIGKFEPSLTKPVNATFRENNYCGRSKLGNNLVVNIQGPGIFCCKNKRFHYKLEHNLNGTDLQFLRVQKIMTEEPRAGIAAGLEMKSVFVIPFRPKGLREKR